MAIRVVHSQSGKGSVMLVDVEDGIPRTEFAYLHKQPAYVPYSNPEDRTKAGFVDLIESDKVLHSLYQGGVLGTMLEKGEISVETDFMPAEPVIDSAELFPTGLLIQGTELVSEEPAVTTVNIPGNSSMQIGSVGAFIAGETYGPDRYTAFTATGVDHISIPKSALPRGFKLGSTVAVKADSNISDKAEVAAGA